jgi:hypothetical protein
VTSAPGILDRLQTVRRAARKVLYHVIVAEDSDVGRPKVREGWGCGRTPNGGMSTGEKLEKIDPDVLRDHDVGKRFEAFNFGFRRDF